jgi:hypothetical protein
MYLVSSVTAFYVFKGSEQLAKRARKSIMASDVDRRFNRYIDRRSSGKFSSHTFGGGKATTALARTSALQLSTNMLYHTLKIIYYGFSSQTNF